MRFSNLKLNKIEKLPKTAGVYCFKDGKKILYIGKATSIRERVKNHFHPVKYREAVILPKAKLFNRVKQIGYSKTNSEIEALILEANLIKKYQPKYNVVWRDDKNYFYLGVTKEDFPRVFWTHQTKLKTDNLKLKTDYVGPFVDGKSLKATLKSLRKVFPYRSCYKIPNRPCLWYQLNRCPAPCLLKSSTDEDRIFIMLNKKMKKECQENAKNLMKILKEGKNPVLKDLKREMKFASKKQCFEEAAKIRDQIVALEKILAHSKIFSPENQYRVNSVMANYYDIEKWFKKILIIKKRVSRIEAYDVSNIQGQEATGSMVTFINGQPDKNFYRRFKIKISGKPDDIAMIKEILSRRFKHSEWPYPDLILIDGGKAQLKAALSVYPTPGVGKVMALAKKRNELFIEGEKEPILLKNLPRGIFNLILQLRDEAHRFAISYHRKLREKHLL